MTALRVMTFNILDGGGDRFPQILDVIATQAPDLLVLQECRDWDDGERLAAVAGVLDVPNDERHVHLGRARPRPSGSRYHVAAFSRHPITSARDHADPSVIGHCLVELQIDVAGVALTVFGAHLDYFSEDLRRYEIAHLHALLDPAAFRAGHHLLVGDLNSLSPRDPYPPGLDDLLRAAGTDKYGHPPRFDVISDIESFGWIDLLRARPETTDNWVTAVRDRGGVHIDYRTDYIFASPALAAVAAEVRVVPIPTGPEGASDHHPVSADLIVTP